MPFFLLKAFGRSDERGEMALSLSKGHFDEFGGTPQKWVPLSFILSSSKVLCFDKLSIPSQVEELKAYGQD